MQNKIPVLFANTSSVPYLSHQLIRTDQYKSFVSFLKVALDRSTHFLIVFWYQLIGRQRDHTDIYKYYLVLEFGAHSLNWGRSLWNIWNDACNCVSIWIFRRKSTHNFHQIPKGTMTLKRLRIIDLMPSKCPLEAERCYYKGHKWSTTNWQKGGIPKGPSRLPIKSLISPKWVQAEASWSRRQHKAYFTLWHIPN